MKLENQEEEKQRPWELVNTHKKKTHKKKPNERARKGGRMGMGMKWSGGEAEDNGRMKGQEKSQQESKEN